MEKVDCPYCDKEQDINTDDGDCYEEDTFNVMECSDCLKIFVFTNAIIHNFSAHKADCLNGADHRYIDVCHQPRHWPDWVRCFDCGDSVKGRFVKEPA